MEEVGQAWDSCSVGLHLARTLTRIVTPEQLKMIYAQWHWLFHFVFLETKEKKISKRDYLEIWNFI